MLNLDIYKIKENNLPKLINIEKGFILNPFVSYKGWKSIEDLTKADLPDLAYNANFYRKKNIHRNKILHITDELEIINIDVFKCEVEKVNGVINQYIGDGEIITELDYVIKESNEAFLKRVLKELEASHVFYNRPFYEKRFYISGMPDSDKEMFTSVVLNNAVILLDYLNKL